jgi:hypothetical protein
MLAASADAATKAIAPANPARKRATLSTTVFADMDSTSVTTQTRVPITTARCSVIRCAIGLAASAPVR